MRKPLSTFWARRIRWGLKAGSTWYTWPAIVLLPATRRAFNRGWVEHQRASYHPIILNQNFNNAIARARQRAGRQP